MTVPGYERITIEEDKMGGVPCIRGYRMPVASVVRYLGSGWTREQILRDWPWLENADIDEALLYAANLAEPQHDAA